MDTGTSTSHKKACVTCAQEFEGQEDSCPFDGTKLTVISEQLIVGTMLGGRYEIMAMVADGGMGKVYKARHKLMNRLVAIKTMLPSVVSSGTALKRFQQEAEAVSLLNHPNILAVHDFFISDDGQPYLVMDYLEGTNLGELLTASQGQLSAACAIPIFIMACAGLGHAHEKGIVHRDVKPANIMLVDYEGKPNFVKIIDFGIAKLAPGEAGERSQLTATGDIFGSPQFMSPEQCRAKPLDSRSDIYSLGCVMYVALSGLSPFGGQDPIESMYKQVHDIPPSLNQADSKLNIPAELEEIIMKAMAKEPDDRYQTMNEMREALEAVYVQLPDAPADYVAMLKSTFVNVSAAQPKQTLQSSTAAQKKTNKIAYVKSGGEIAHKLIDSLRKCPRNVLYGAVILAVVIGSICWFYESRHQATIKQMTEMNDAAQKADQEDQTEPAQSLTPDQNYSLNLQKGQEAYKAGHYNEALKLFSNAYNIAGDFGQRDPRYVDSLEWAGKTEYQLGDYLGAKQALVYVIYVNKGRYGSNSRQVATAKKELADVMLALNQK